MAKEDVVIDLASSDEDAEPPAKKININAMVHIPTKMHGITIKPVKGKPTQLPKLPKNITITKTTASQPFNKNKMPESLKNKSVRKKITPPINKNKVINPLNQMKKGVIIQSVGNSTITKLKTPIQIKKPQINKPQPLQRLPPSITIKKTQMKPLPNVVCQRRLQQACNVVSNALRKRKIVLPPVTLDDEVPSTSKHPQWYVRPEDQSTSHEKAAKEVPVEAQTTPQETVNNKEPEGDRFIEITIEDSPIKPPKVKRTRELSTENVITIDDSPNKGIPKANVAEGSDEEADTVKKGPQSKKKLEYEGDLEVIEEHRTLEIEILPMDPEPDVDEVLDTKVISLTPEIMEEEQASVEIAQNKQGAVSVVQIKPSKPKQPKETCKEDILKKKSAIKSEFHPIYQAFITLCLKLENSDDMEKIIEKKIKPYYRQVPKEYAESDEFLDMVYSKITAIEAAPAKLYLYIKDIVDELNLQRKICRPSLANKFKEKVRQSFALGREQELNPRKLRQIKRLEVTLKKLNRAIQKLENQEVNFDDEEDSVYLLTEKYKERMVRVHAKFCQLTNTRLPTEPRLVIEARPGLSTAPAKKLEDFINQNNKVVFPDFQDVLRCVREANEESGLGWTETCIMEEARDLFVRCGRKIQRRRQENEWRLATSRITPNSDPAEKNEVLKNQLDANRRVASTKESEVFEQYCDKQSQMKLEAEEIDDKDAEGSPSESEEEENEEPCSLENKQRRKERIKRLLQEISKKNNRTTDDINPIETEQNISQEIEIESDADQESKIQILSDDTNEMGSDMDELNLLQKLHSGSERRTSDSSDSESPLSISDTLESSSDDNGRGTRPLSPDIVSIENSSYSDESDSEKNSKGKTNKESTKEIKEIHNLPSTSRDVKNTHTSAIVTESMAISSSDEESAVNTKAGPSGESAKNEMTPDKDFESSIQSETADLCEDADECAKPSDAEDEQSLNSDILENRVSSASSESAKKEMTPEKDFESSIQSETTDLCDDADESVKPSDVEDEQSLNSDILENRVSSASSGQFEELLKEHNADQLYKRPDPIPRDASDKLFDNLVMRHYNDPLVKAHLKSSDESNAENAENSNSDTQSLDASITAEEAKKDLIESSVDTAEMFCASPSLQIVDKFIEKLKDSDGSLSSNDSLLEKVDEHLDLNPEAGSPITLALEKAVSAARKTKNWPRFRDECSSLSSLDAYGDNVSDSSPKPAKIDSPIEPDGWSLDSSKDPHGRIDDNQSKNNPNKPKACSSKSSKALLEKMKTADRSPAFNKNINTNTESSSSSIDDDNTYSPSIPPASSESANDNLDGDADLSSSESAYNVTVETGARSEASTTESMEIAQCEDSNMPDVIVAQNADKQSIDGDRCDLEATKCGTEGMEVTVSDTEFIKSNATSSDPSKNQSEEMEAVVSKNASVVGNTTNDNTNEKNIVHCEASPTAVETTATEGSELNAKSLESKKNIPEHKLVQAKQVCNEDSQRNSFLDIAEYCRTRDNSQSVPMETDGSESEIKSHSKTSDENNDESSIEQQVTSECKDLSRKLDDTDIEMTSADANIDAASTKTVMNIDDSVTPLTEAKLDSKDSSVSSIANGKLNINMEISDLLPADANLPENNGGGNTAQADFSEISMEKDCREEETAPSTITSVQGTE